MTLGDGAGVGSATAINMRGTIGLGRPRTPDFAPGGAPRSGPPDLVNCPEPKQVHESCGPGANAAGSRAHPLGRAGGCDDPDCRRSMLVQIAGSRAGRAARFSK